MGGLNPIRIQSMTTTDTMDTEATVAQVIKCIEAAGLEIVEQTDNIGLSQTLLRCKKKI